MLSVLVDTNVLISGIISPHGFPRKVYQAWRDNRFTLIITSQIKAEIKEVLNRPKIAKRYHLSQRRINRILQALHLYSQEIEDKESLKISFSDPKDVKFLTAAKTAQADYLVTGDKELLELMEFHSTKIVSPKEFIGILSE